MPKKRTRMIFDPQEDVGPFDTEAYQGPYYTTSQGVETEDGRMLCVFEYDCNEPTRKLLASAWSLREALRQMIGEAERVSISGRQFKQ